MMMLNMEGNIRSNERSDQILKHIVFMTCLGTHVDLRILVALICALYNVVRVKVHNI